MGNCLITQFKVSVQNGSLPPFNGTIIHDAQSRSNFKISSTDGVSEVTIIGDGYFGTPGTKTYVCDGTVVDFVSNGCNLKITNKDKIYLANMRNADFSELVYFTSLAYYDIPVSYGDIGNLANTAVSQLTLGSTDIYGDITKLPAGFKRLWLNNCNVIASNLAAFVASMADIAVKDSSPYDGNIRLKGNSNVTGTIESVVAACVNAGRVNKDIVFDIKGTNVTFGGSNDVAQVSSVSNHLCHLKWTDKTHITYQLGNDSDVEDSSVNVHIFAKGATAEQISTWESQGNTVHVVS